MSFTRASLATSLRALKSECVRQQTQLRAPSFPTPYYISYLVRDNHTVHISGRLGNLNQVTDHHHRNVYGDVRVGSYEFDQVQEGGLDDHDTESECYEHVEMPIGNDPDALRYHLWKLTDGRYREAVRHYFRKKSRQITYLDPNEGIASFSKKNKAIQDISFSEVAAIDTAHWQHFVERSSLCVKQYFEIKNSTVELRIRDVTRLFVNSEGSEIVEQQRICELSCELWLLNADGDEIVSRIVHVTPQLEALPTIEQFIQQIEHRIQLLKALSQAPTLKSYAGPVLLAPGPAGILFHEVLGHRLEGNRLLSSREGQTFARDLGKQIIPECFTIIDDPSVTTSASMATIGSYRYDDEGSPGERVVLIDKGKLTHFLTGRSPISTKYSSNNGHARSEYHERPISRMANLIVEATGGLSETELKKRFVEEIKKQKQAFGDYDYRCSGRRNRNGSL